MRSRIPALLLAAAVAAASPSLAVGQGGTVYVNHHPATAAQLDGLRRLYGSAPPAGRWWYDAVSGLYGPWGGAAIGYIRPGHRFAPLPREASAGSTGVIINGRELPLVEVRYLQAILGSVRQGRWWLDGRTGNFGAEGSTVVVGNLVAAVRAAQRGGGGYRWRDATDGSIAGAENGCVWMSTPDRAVMTGDC